MKKEWFAAKDLVGINGLPTSTQGIHGMARRQGWEKRRRMGVQGRAVEYHIDSLPNMTKPALIIQEKSAEYLCASYHDPLLIWIESYKQLSEAEREQIVSFIVREGMTAMIKRISFSDEKSH
ncbi:putative DNA-binding transcriptional regulator [Rouxiella sp. S1S-2]|uniref:DNA-binding protein n=1 Tax=Rouxiella sp. S1S-2 TaxID=2653856 RepID=UPI001265677D|nr:DNA-binding protein [Rouxiella sp. S1S-2]KAB7895130.1 putative DNA-binding transcriptional regulator [Rouxiella sp. S1S-2]